MSSIKKKQKGKKSLKNIYGYWLSKVQLNNGGNFARIKCKIKFKCLCLIPQLFIYLGWEISLERDSM